MEVAIGKQAGELEAVSQLTAKRQSRNLGRRE
jgi:hypothetical protein